MIYDYCRVNSSLCLQAREQNTVARNTGLVGQLIKNIQDDNYYAGAIIYRREWRVQYDYHLMIPLSSCAYCDVYDQNGKKVVWRDWPLMDDYLRNRKNEQVIWGWNDSDPSG